MAVNAVALPRLEKNRKNLGKTLLAVFLLMHNTLSLGNNVEK